MTPRQLRLLRGAAASMSATVTAAVSHTFGGGAPPHPLLVLALGVFLTPAAALFVGRKLRVGGLTAAVLVAQAIFHALFVALGATLTPEGVVGGHHHAIVLPAAGAVREGVAAGDAMIVAHLGAALVTVVLLWRGEQLLRAIARWVRTVLRRRLLPPRTDFPLRPGLAAPVGPFVSAVRTGDLCLRGPPAFSCG